jgi:hypothetical protein
MKDAFWPADFLPQDCESARIITWGYECASGCETNNFLDKATDFITNLAAIRPLGRSLVFVAHSFGGIFLKETLRLAEQAESLESRDIVSFTSSAFFFGTPHWGDGDALDFIDIVQLTAQSVLGTDGPILFSPKLREKLELGRNTFLSQWKTYDFHVVSFVESKSDTTDETPPERGFTVPKASASFHKDGGHINIKANHMNICRYVSPTDPGYILAGSELKVYLSQIKNHELHMKDDCLKSLYFAELQNREFAITSALEKTATWLFEHEEYINWARWDMLHTKDRRGLLWLKGKPGSGKSTLMKEGLQRAKAHNLGFDSSICIAGFFFTTRGNIQLQRTPLGLFQTVIYDLVQQDRALLCAFISEYKKKVSGSHGPWKWHQEELQKFLRSAYMGEISGVRKAMLFIDALDECDDNDSYNTTRDLVYYFRDITAENKLKVCLSSRHYPYIKVPDCPQVVVENFNSQDVLRFVNTQLLHAEHDTRARDLAEKIAAKAEGVFLWVILVVKSLKIGLDNNKTSEDLEETLRAVPKKLEDVFKQLFVESPSKKELLKTATIFQWVLLAARPLHIDELRHVLTISLEDRVSPPNVKNWADSGGSLPADPESFLTSLRFYTRGLAEVIGRKPDWNPTEPERLSTTNRLLLEQTVNFFQSIFFLDKYKAKSPEELRVLDYSENRRYGTDNRTDFSEDIGLQERKALERDFTYLDRHTFGVVRSPEQPYNHVVVRASSATLPELPLSSRSQASGNLGTRLDKQFERSQLYSPKPFSSVTASDSNLSSSGSTFSTHSKLSTFSNFDTSFTDASFNLKAANSPWNPRTDQVFRFSSPVSPFVKSSQLASKKPRSAKTQSHSKRSMPESRFTTFSTEAWPQPVRLEHQLEVPVDEFLDASTATSSATIAGPDIEVSAIHNSNSERNLAEEAVLKSTANVRLPGKPQGQMQDELYKESDKGKTKEGKVMFEKKGSKEEKTASAEESAEEEVMASIKFKLFNDAMGREFEFPFHLCRTWLVGYLWS